MGEFGAAHCVPGSSLIRDVDAGGERVFLRQDEQRFGRRQTATDSWTWPSGLDPPTDRGGNRGPPRDGERLPEGGWDRRNEPKEAWERSSKTSHFRGGVHRPWAVGDAAQA